MSETKQEAMPAEPDDAERVDPGEDPQTENGSIPDAAEERAKDLESRLEAKTEECREILDKLLRVSAEFDNYKKRAAREMEDFRKYANQSLLKEMLSALDHIELAIQAASGTCEIGRAHV